MDKRKRVNPQNQSEKRFKVFEKETEEKWYDRRQLQDLIDTVNPFDGGSNELIRLIVDYAYDTYDRDHMDRLIDVHLKQTTNLIRLQFLRWLSQFPWVSRHILDYIAQGSSQRVYDVKNNKLRSYILDSSDHFTKTNHSFDVMMQDNGHLKFRSVMSMIERRADEPKFLFITSNVNADRSLCGKFKMTDLQTPTQILNTMDSTNHHALTRIFESPSAMSNEQWSTLTTVYRMTPEMILFVLLVTHYYRYYHQRCRQKQCLSIAVPGFCHCPKHGEKIKYTPELTSIDEKHPSPLSHYNVHETSDEYEEIMRRRER